MRTEGSTPETSMMELTSLKGGPRMQNVEQLMLVCAAPLESANDKVTEFQAKSGRNNAARPWLDYRT
ncbi:hypothetical protein KPH14_004116 [Odynerus spinipes]|uniref:Uncharacterized protein n=1 Tax=Odynerus spinipes TaxID=1348599 RepID=A0AAD9VVV4_9HYME|nr:hypothetical protein KPH14_004116 [Odynerus spinipes]